MNTPKDRWDKVDILAKIFSAVGIGALTLYLTFANSSINQKHSNHELLEKLLMDVSDDHNTKRDISLHALNYMYQSGSGVPDKILFREILRYVYMTTAGKTNECDIAKKYLKEIGDKDYLDSFATESAKAIPASLQADSSITKKEIEEKTEQLNNAVKASVAGVVYIQFPKKTCDALLTQIRTELKGNGYTVPQADLITKYPILKNTEIRYSHKEDSTRARQIVSILENLKVSDKIIMRKLNPDNFKIPPPQGLLELWLSPAACP